MQPNCSFRLNLYIALYFCFVGITNAQTPQAGLASSPSDTSGVLAICQGMQVTFTAFQSGLATAPKSFEFLLVRTGTATITARTRSDSNIWVATAGTDFLHGDQILVRAYDRTTSQGGGTPYDSRRILLQITNPPPVTLSSDAPGNTFCNNETVNFSVSPQIAGAQYSFYVDGKLQQGPNALSQFSTQNLADNDIVSVEVHALKIQRNGLSNTLANLSYVYKLQLNNSTFFLPGITIGFGSNAININDFIFEDQLNATTGFINTETIDPLGNDLGNVNYLDLGASFIVHSDRYIFGLSLKHLNGPNTSFNKEKQDKKPLLIGVQGGIEFDLDPYERSFLSRYTFLYAYGAMAFHDGVAVLNLSQDLQLGQLAFGLSQQFSKRTTPQLNNIGISTALSVENFDFGLQYNFPMRNLKTVYAPSVLELFVTFNFSQFRRNNRGLFKRLQIDNYL